MQLQDGQWHFADATALLTNVERCTSGPESGRRNPKRIYICPQYWKLQPQKTIPDFYILCLKRKDMSYPLLVVPRGKSLPCPVLGTWDGSSVSMNSSFSKKQHKNALSKALFSKTWNILVVFYYYTYRTQFQGHCSSHWLNLWFQQEQGCASILCKLARNLCTSIMLDYMISMFFFLLVNLVLLFK